MKATAGSPSPRSLLTVCLDECNEATRALGADRSSPRRDAWQLATCIARGCTDHDGALRRIEGLLRPHLAHLVELAQRLRAKGVPSRTILDRVILGHRIDMSAYIGGSAPVSPRISTPTKAPAGVAALKARSRSFEMEMARRRSCRDAESALLELRRSTPQTAGEATRRVHRGTPCMFHIED